MNLSMGWPVFRIPKTSPRHSDQEADNKDEDADAGHHELSDRANPHDAFAPGPALAHVVFKQSVAGLFVPVIAG